MGIITLQILNSVVSSVLGCAGGFGGNIGHDPHLLYTLSAIQVLALFDKIDVLDIEKVSNCILLYVINRNWLWRYFMLLLISA